MSKFFYNEPTLPEEGDVFGPRPNELEQRCEQVKSEFGADSFEYASALVQLGDAHMVQGKLANPKAQQSYEHALKIVSTENGSSAEVAYVFDKLANVKQSSGDTAGAATDLAKAIEIWNNLDANSKFVTDHHIKRRAEDLEGLQRVVAFQNRRPPDL